MNVFRLKNCNYANQKFNGSALPLVALALTCFAISPMAQAVVPAPDGGYPNFNTAEGQNALFSLTTGAANTAVGWLSLRALTTGNFNTGVGAGTLLNNTADRNTATGAAALLSNTTGERNTGNGTFTLFSNTSGDSNTATGSGALASNTTGHTNTAIGVFALQANITGVSNTAIGVNALFNNTGGNSNTAIGNGALGSNTVGINNTALGGLAGFNQTTGSGNIYIGHGVPGVAGESSACYIASIFNQTSADGTQVFINSNNKLGTSTSSKRFKEDIKPMDNASKALFSLKPVTFRYKQDIDPDRRGQFGLVAEDVANVNPDLVVRDAEGKVNTVRYDAVNAMLLNEFLKEHKKVEEQQATIVELKSNDAQRQQEIKALATTVNEQAAQIQKVSAQLEASNPAPQVVNNP